jgi:hypothetical protein
MVSIGLCRSYITITIRNMDIGHRPVFLFESQRYASGFCTRLQAEPTHFGRIDEASPCLRKV